MKISRFSNGLVEPLVAISKVVGDMSYHNISHGGPCGWEFRSAVDYRLTKKMGDKPFQLDGDEFILREIKKGGKTVLDNKGNVYYVVTKDPTTNTTLDTILFWELYDKDINDVKDITYKLSGDYTLIGEGDFGTRDKPIPGPVFIVYGEAYFSWSGKNSKNESVGESFRYTLDGKFKRYKE